MEELQELIALGNEGAPKEWLDCFTGQGIGEGYEGIRGETLDAVLNEIALSPHEQEIQATYEIAWNACNSANYTKGRQGRSIDYLVVHYTGGSKTAEGAARANTIYFGRERVGASAHYFIDDGYTIWNSVREEDTAWHAGNWNINTRSIGIEVCSAGEFTGREIERLSWLIQHLMQKYNIPASRVIRHYDSNGKHCPAHYVDAARWNALRAQITSTVVTAVSASKPTTANKPASKPVNSSVSAIQAWCGVKQDGIFGPLTKAGLVRKLQGELNAQFNAKLAVDGKFGPKTKAACVNVRKGAQGNITKVLQGILICLGYNTGGFDGKFGDKTYAAVRAFQAARGLTQDGVAGKNTFAALLG